MTIPIGYCEVWFRFDLTGDVEPMYTHLAYSTLEPPTQTVIDAGFTAFVTAFKPFFSPSMLLSGGHVLIGNDGGAIRWESSITPVVGTGSANCLPQNSAYLLKKQSALGGRKNRGRMYLPCPPESNIGDAGTVNTSIITAINAAAVGLTVGGAIVNAFDFLGGPVILHEAAIDDPTPVTDLVTDRYIATQRRRLRR